MITIAYCWRTFQDVVVYFGRDFLLMEHFFDGLPGRGGLRLQPLLVNT